MPRRRLFALSLVFTMFASTAAHAELFLRWNQAGYTPERPKSLVAMSTTDLTGQVWRIECVDTMPLDTPAAPILQGSFGPSLGGLGEHTPLPFNHTADFTSLAVPGVYRFVTAGATPAELRIAPAPYAALRPEPLRHLRLMRSGSPDVAPRRYSHPGDARAPVFVPAGDPSNGKWQPAAPGRTLDGSGGWYDAGDQIKFTLNIAYTSYHLLLAYRLAPELFGRPAADAPLPPLLDEARHGLEFLMRTFPDRETFLIQVGDENDHNQTARLPEDDPLDGHRRTCPRRPHLPRTRPHRRSRPLCATGPRHQRPYPRTGHNRRGVRTR